jgi:hypothetical protein
LVFSDVQATTGRDIWTLELGGAASPVLVTPFNERAPALSPDGRWLAYVSDEAGREEVYVQAYPGLGRRVQISTNGGREPVWSADGRELFYRSLDGRQMMVVEVEAAQTFNAGPARVLFEGAYVSSPPGNGTPYYDVLRDGQRFLMTRPSAGSPRPGQIYVVLNWFEELRRLVPSR